MDLGKFKRQREITQNPVRRETPAPPVRREAPAPTPEREPVPA